MIGTFNVTAGQQLKILVGEQPSVGSGNGGGGGTFVTDMSNNPMIIAGGGGGSSESTDSPEKHGKISTSGGNGAAGGGAGGINGNGGAVGISGFQSGAGGGFFTDGANGWTTNTGGLAFLNGGSGGTANTNARGGYGGGGSGSSYVVGGGGGGYSGGGSGGNTFGGVGGGGGSFNGGTDQVNTGGANAGNGRVIITGIILYPPDPTLITSSVNPVCSGSTIQLTADGAVGTVYWYTDSCGGTEIGTGNPINVAPSATTTYFARNFNSGLFSEGCASLTVITLSDYHINGYARYYNNPKTPLDGLNITLKQGGVAIAPPYVTGPTGYYDFGGLVNGTYDLEISSSYPSGQWQTWNGVNNTDYLLVSRHATGAALLATEPPVVRVSASVVAPHPAILTADANAVKNAARYGWFMPGTTTPWFDIPKWVFSGITTATAITGFELNCNNLTRDIYGLCTGDVNGSYIPPSGYKMAETLHATSLQLVNCGTLPITQEITFPVRAGQDMEIGAITLLLNFDPAIMEITGVEMPENKGQEPYFIVNGDQLHIGWMSLDPVQAIEGQTVLIVRTRMLNAEQGMLNDEGRIRFTLDTNPLCELADGVGEVIDGARLVIADAGHQSPVTSHDELFSVYPNPAKDILHIEAITGIHGEIIFALTDLNGKTILTKQISDATTMLRKDKLDVSGLDNGIYILKITTHNFSSTRKVIINK